jgi:hypothetical protein
MGIFPPVYPCEELEELNERQREILRDAVCTKSRLPHRFAGCSETKPFLYTIN